MSNDELLHQIMQTRYDFAAAVMAYHKSGCDDDALLRRVGENERAYLDAVIADVVPDIAAAVARWERDKDRMLNLLATPPEGNA